MSRSVTIHEAKTQFSKLVRRVEEGEEIIVRRGATPVARLVPLEQPKRITGRGSLKDQGFWMADDWDEPLEEFKEYM